MLKSRMFICQILWGFQCIIVRLLGMINIQTLDVADQEKNIQMNKIHCSLFILRLFKSVLNRQCPQNVDNAKHENAMR